MRYMGKMNTFFSKYPQCHSQRQALEWSVCCSNLDLIFPYCSEATYNKPLQALQFKKSKRQHHFCQCLLYRLYLLIAFVYFSVRYNLGVIEVLGILFLKKFIYSTYLYYEYIMAQKLLGTKHTTLQTQSCFCLHGVYHLFIKFTILDQNTQAIFNILNYIINAVGNS